MRYALLWTSPPCTVEGCTRTTVEHDHRYGAEYQHTRHTRLDELDRLCHPHHDLHTHHHWALIRGTSNSPMVPPHDTPNPANNPPAGAARPPPTHAPKPTETTPTTHATHTTARQSPTRTTHN